jgi:hypothetical protein
LSLYFNSDRPGGHGGMDIWVAQRKSLRAPWGIPWNLGPTINTSELEAVPSLSPDGHWMFFNSTRPGGFGQHDVWASYRINKHDDFAWGPPMNLGPPVNTEFVDAGARLFANRKGGGPLLYFVSTRPGGLGNFDIYISAITSNGFGPATLIPELSSTANDRRPSLRRDGLEVFFDSDRAGSLDADLWTSTRDSLHEPWSIPVNMGATVNSAATDLMPYLARDRETLFFTSNRPGGSGSFDLYLTTRRKAHGVPERAR